MSDIKVMGKATEVIPMAKEYHILDGKYQGRILVEIVGEPGSGKKIRGSAAV